MQELPVLGYKKLVVYQKSKELVLSIYKLTAKYPKSETYSLVDQMRRSAVSVPANLIEGYSKESSAEFARFLTISIGSLAELEFYIEISLDLKYIDLSISQETNSLVYEVKNFLYRMRKSVWKCTVKNL
jgi:four helix bundle protein